MLKANWSFKNSGLGVYMYTFLVKHAYHTIRIIYGFIILPEYPMLAYGQNIAFRTSI